MRLPFLKLSLLAALFAGSLVTPCRAATPVGQVTLEWGLSPSLGVSGYNLCWGTSSGVYTFTNTFAANQTNGTISNLVANQAYFIAVQAVSSNGGVSIFSSEVSFTYVPSTNSSSSSSGPPTPVFVASTNSGGASVVSGNGGSSSSISSSGSGSGSGSSGSTTTNSPASISGVPPYLTLTVSDGQPNLNIAGTVGATIIIQSTTNPLSMNNWETMTNITLTNIAPVAAGNQTSQAQNLLNVAFVPALQEFPVTFSDSTPFQFFRVVMPYDYVILANIVLSGQGYAPKLIVVNMPGFVDDACYANEASSFICFDNPALQLVGSGPSIRQIATSLANSLGMNWTTASQVTYDPTNGLGQILATVVETESPSSDPVPGQSPPSAPIAINF